MRLRNGVSPGVGHHHDIPRSSGYKLRPPDTKYTRYLHCPTADQIECIASRLPFRFVGVICMTRPDLLRVIVIAFMCNKLHDTTAKEYTLMSNHF